MAKFKTFPHFEVEVVDRSIVEVFRPEVLPLHRPMFLGFAEKGPIGIPMFGDYTDHSGVLGKATFDQYSDYFKHSNLFFKDALTFQKAFFVRIATADAAYGSVVIEAHVKENVQMLQYQKDEFGSYLLDDDGNPIPVTDGGGVPVSENGIELTWKSRPLAADEKANGLQSSSTAGVSIYPIMVLSATSPGAWANKAGVKIWFEPTTADAAQQQDIGSILFNMAPVEQPYGYDTPIAIRNLFNNPSTEFSFKPGAIDPSTERRVELEDIIVNDYKNAIPFDITYYSEFVQAIGEKVIAVEPDMLELTTPWMVDIMSATSVDGQPYDHFVVKTDSEDAIMLDENVIQYMSGGNDGDMSNESFESLTKQWLTGEVYPDITDQARYPITHLYDSGYTLDTKKGMIDFLGVRDDVKVIMSTQDVTLPPNAKEEDQSTGSAIRAQALLHPESTIYGTQVCRVTILQQCGRLAANPNWKQWVPATLDCMRKKCRWQGAVYFKGAPKGLPNSDVSIFSEVNWFPNSDDHKQLSWDTGLNWMQYYDMSSYHYADVRSVYPYETSVISDDIFCDKLIYLKHIARQNWARFAGRDENPELLFGEIREAISDDIYRKFGNFLKFEVLVYQTDADKALGYKSTVEIRVYGNLPQRVWTVLVPVYRESQVA